MSFVCEPRTENGKYQTVFTDAVAEQSVNFDKCRLIAWKIGRTPILAFGNSSGDTEMLNYTLSHPTYPSLSVVINHDDGERERAYKAEKMASLYEQNGWLCVSMKEDFLTVY